jgi:hypothetical protein
MVRVRDYLLVKHPNFIADSEKARKVGLLMFIDADPYQGFLWSKMTNNCNGQNFILLT